MFPREHGEILERLEVAQVGYGGKNWRAGEQKRQYL